MSILTGLIHRRGRLIPTGLDSPGYVAQLADAEGAFGVGVALDPPGPIFDGPKTILPCTMRVIIVHGKGKDGRQFPGRQGFSGQPRRRLNPALAIRRTDAMDR